MPALLRALRHACKPACFCGPGPPHGSRMAAHAAASPAPPAQHAHRVKLAVVGDVHGDWDRGLDEAALRCLAPDMVLFVGDFGEEDVQLVQEVAALPMPYAAILGNHDAWWTQVERPGKKKATKPSAPAAPAPAAPASGSADGAACDGPGTSTSNGAAQHGPTGQAGSAPHPALDPAGGVQQQLRALGDAHIGYRSMQVPGAAPLLLVGARPFSKGGPGWASIAGFMAALHGVGGFAESAQRIVAAAAAAQPGSSLVLMGHNAPEGLGSRRHDIAGIDWMPSAGDHGDPDLRAALDALHRQGQHVALVLCGHMHHRLQGSPKLPSLRRMAAVDRCGALVLNAATVPRVTRPQLPPSSAQHAPPAKKRKASALRALQQQQQQQQAVQGPGEVCAPTWRHFLMVDLVELGAPGGAAGGAGGGMRVAEARDTWVEVRQESQQGSSETTTTARVVQEQAVARTTPGATGLAVSVWDAYAQRWVDSAVPWGGTQQGVSCTC